MGIKFQTRTKKKIHKDFQWVIWRESLIQVKYFKMFTNLSGGNGKRETRQSSKEFNLQAIYKYAYASKNKKDHSSGSDLF